MNLADMLSYADIHDLSRIAGTYNCECNGHSKNDLIQSILSTVGRKEIFERQVGDMTLEDIRFLNSLLFDQRGLFSLEELVARAQQSRVVKEPADEGWNPREVISRFKQRGWLFSGYSHQTRYLFQVPADLKRRFIAALGKQFEQKLQRTNEPSVYRDEQKLVAEDIRNVLLHLRGQEMMLTADHAMYKRNLQQLLEKMAVMEEPVGKTAWRFGYGRMFREYPNRFSFIYDYCYFHDYITEHNQVLALTAKGAEQADSGVREDPAEVYRFWLRLYKGPIPNIQSLVHWINHLAKSWVTVASLKEALGGLIRPFYYDTPDSIFDQRLLQMMMHLGLLRVGEDTGHGAVVQMTRMGSSIIEGTYIADEEQIVIPFDNP